MKPLISIITITFQAESHLRRTAESVLNQSYSNIEYIIVDGGSKDQTISIIKEYEEKFNLKSIPFRWISEQDNGIYDAMNKGMQLATGDYVWFVNSGDKIASETCLEDIFRSPFAVFNGKGKLSGETCPSEDLPDFIYGETFIVNEQGDIMGPRRLKAPERLNWRSFRMGMLVCHQSMLVKRSIAPRFDLQYKYSSDFDWTIRCLKQSTILYNTHMVLSHFLDGGVSKRKMRTSLMERFKIMSKNYGVIPTTLRHSWFIFRAAWFKLIHGWI
jgi:Glycosyltransferases involved in cell wall biogenesis